MSQSSPDEFHDLRMEIDRALCDHRTVLITPAASEYISDSELSLVGVSRESLEAFFHEYEHKGKIIFWYRNLLDGRQLPIYALAPPETC